jgi:hypothetical protein
MQKKAQTEIVGLIVIVSVVVLFMVITVFSKAKKTTEETTNLFQDSKLVSSLIYSILSTDITVDDVGNSLKLRTILQDCTSKQKIKCFDTKNHNYIDSCTCFKKVMNTTLNNTMHHYSAYYKFIVTIEKRKNNQDITIPVFSKTNCTEVDGYNGVKTDYSLPVFNNSEHYSTNIMFMSCLDGED